jgi:hypothetical protein|tara:strand:- start:6123 stop:6383 length:261 start_codon:yes stop_codon:yes gene_type:complete
MPTDQDVFKAQQAEQILDSEVFQEVIENLKNEYINFWLNSRKIEDVTIREDLHRVILLIPEIEKHLRIMAEKGKLTKTHINRLKTL